MKNFEQTLAFFNEHLAKYLAGTKNEPEYLYEPVKYALSAGGKRIRPVFCLMATEMFGGKMDAALDTALGLEIFHNFTLLHDDIMDNSAIRRNRPTVHKKWNNNVAILSGDLMSLEACKCVAKCGNKQVLDLFFKTAIEIYEGQQYDMDFETQLDVSETEYLEMINLKTAVFLAASLQAGAILAGATSSDSENIYRYGQNIGLAFQLQDDLLDTYGNTKTFGKPIGGDIAENKKTYLLINALKLADEPTKNELLRWLCAENCDKQEKFLAVKSIYDKLGIKELTIRKINAYFDIADEYLKSISIETEMQQNLMMVVEAMKEREY